MPALVTLAGCTGASIDSTLTVGGTASKATPSVAGPRFWIAQLTLAPSGTSQ